MPSLLHKLRSQLHHRAGLDGAVAYTAMARLCSIVGSVGTVLLLVRFLSSVEQGYYYALLSLVLLQTVFELGFSFVIQQYAAHESVLCTFSPDGTVAGDSAAHARLASVLQLAVRWYLLAAISIALFLLPAGFWFFTRNSHGDGVAWQGPWVATVLASAASFLLVPLYSFLEGCNQIRQVAKARFVQAIVVLAMSWSAMISGHGLYASALVNSGAIMVGVVFLTRRRRLLMGLMRWPSAENAVSWRREIWPFQWKVAVSWLCTYFISQLFTPILFHARGPVEAGRMGMSINIVAYLPIVVLSWITTKATPFGQFIKLGRLAELDHLFFRTFRQAMTLLIVMVTGCWLAITLLPHLSIKLAARMESPRIFALLLITAVCTFAVQSMAIYLRSFKEEPFLLQSVTVFTLTTVSVLIAAPRWGSLGVAASYFVSSGLLGLTIAAFIFRSKMRIYRSLWITEAAVPAEHV